MEDICIYAQWLFVLSFQFVYAKLAFCFSYFFSFLLLTLTSQYHAVPTDSFLSSFSINKLPSFFYPLFSSVFKLTSFLTFLLPPLSTNFFVFCCNAVFFIPKKRYYRAKVKLYSGEWVIGQMNERRYERGNRRILRKK